MFSELYSAYYNAVAAILRAAAEHPVTGGELRKLVEAYAFSESIPAIEQAFRQERWQLLRGDGTTPLKAVPDMPLSILQRRWLKAISLDPRIRLFDYEVSGLEEVEPLFAPEDVYVFDKYADGDPYEDETYIQNFRRILDALKKRYPLSIDVVNSRGGSTHINAMPQYLEYSEKDDKFRLITTGCRYGRTVNLAKILDCKAYREEDGLRLETLQAARKMFKTDGLRCIRSSENAAKRSFTIELFDGRNALERVLLHFAHFEKEAERIDGKRYRIKVNYDRDDETELVIRVLSFGPFIRVIEPESFVAKIKERLEMQRSCGPE